MRGVRRRGCIRVFCRAWGSVSVIVIDGRAVGDRGTGNRSRGRGQGGESGGRGKGKPHRLTSSVRSKAVHHFVAQCLDVDRSL